MLLVADPYAFFIFNETNYYQSQSFKIKLINKIIQ